MINSAVYGSLCPVVKLKKALVTEVIFSKLCFLETGQKLNAVVLDYN